MAQSIDVLDMIWDQLQAQISALSTRVDDLEQRSESSETAGGFVAFTYADAPRAAQGGMSDGVSYTDAVWISNGRKPTEGAGLGTGVLAVYSAAVDDWLRVGDYAVVTV